MNSTTGFFAPLPRACATVVMLLLFGCGGGGGGALSSSGGIAGTAIKGPVGGAMVTAYAITNGAMGARLATGTTDASGNFNLSTGSYAGPVMLQLVGGTYTDEAAGSAMSMASGDVMNAVLPSVTPGAMISGVQMTPLTSMAQAMAQHMTGGMSDINIAAANTAVGSYFSVSDILHVVPMNPLVPGSGTGASQSAQNYGMTLAAMSEYAQTQGMSSSSAMVTAMMNDAADGKMDGMAGSSPVMMGGLGMGTSMPSSAGTTGLGAAMNAFMTSSRNKSGITTTTLMNQLNASSGQMLGSGGPVMLNATVTGAVFNGPVSKATVKAYAVNNGVMGAQIASIAADTSGNFIMPLGSYSGPVMLQVTGATYTDEATGTSMAMGASDVMSAVLPTVASGANVTGIMVTPVTSMAQARAVALSGGMTDANIAAANTAMGNYFLINDILHVRPMNPLAIGSGTGATTDMRDYGAAIAAMSEYAKSNTTAVSSAFVTAMMNDASDGVMNGMMGSTQIAMPMSGGMGGGMNGMGNMATTAGTSGLASAMTSFMDSTANSSGLTAADMATLIQKLTASNGQI